jgi:DnaJ domain
MGYFLGGLFVFGFLVLLGRLFVATDPHTLVRLIRYGVGIVLIGIGGVMTLSGRWGLGLPLVAGGLSALSLGRIGPIDLGGDARTPGTGSRVRSRYVRMQLDHDTGAISGEVTSGQFSGRSLDTLDRGELLSLREEVRADGESLALVDAYLDRRMPGWRDDVEGSTAGAAGGGSESGPMTEQQAYEILGLASGAGPAEIRTAHRRLMKKVHPDQGGSTFLAAKINEAKDLLLRKRR